MSATVLSPEIGEIDDMKGDVSIYLYGDQLDPQRITEILGLQPSRAQVKGGPRSTAGDNKRVLPAKIGLWVLSGEKSESTPLSEQVDNLLQRLGTPTQPLDELPNVEDAHLDIFDSFYDRDGKQQTVEIRLSKRQLKRLGQLGLSVHVTVM